MALIKCPECGKKFSEFAEKCPNCGFPSSMLKNTSTIKKSKYDIFVHYFYANDIKSSISFNPNDLKITLTHCDGSSNSFKMKGVLSIGSESDFDISYERIKNSGFKRAFRDGATAAIFGMGLVFDPNEYKTKYLNIIHHFRIPIRNFNDSKKYSLTFFNTDLVFPEDDSFEYWLDSLANDFFETLKTINKLYCKVIKEASIASAKKALNSNELPNGKCANNNLYLMVYHGDSIKVNKIVDWELIKNGFDGKNDCVSIYDIEKKICISYECDAIDVFVYNKSKKQVSHYSEEDYPISKALKLIRHLFNNEKISLAGIEYIDDYEEDEIMKSGFANHSEKAEKILIKTIKENQ